MKVVVKRLAYSNHSVRYIPRRYFCIPSYCSDTGVSLAQVFSSEFCEISKNIFFTEHLRTTASWVLRVFAESNQIKFNLTKTRRCIRSQVKLNNIQLTKT